MRTPEPVLAPASIGAAGCSRESRQGAYHPGGADLSDGMIDKIAHINVAGGVNRYAERGVKPGGRSGTVRVASLWAIGANHQAVPRQRRHEAVGRNLSDRLIIEVRNVKVPAAVHGHAGRAVKLCCAQADSLDRLLSLLLRQFLQSGEKVV